MEGAEFQIIQDLVEEKKIGNCRHYIVEYHHLIEGEKSKLSAFINQFEDNGFEYNIKANYKKIGDFQDVLLSLYKG